MKILDIDLDFFLNNVHCGSVKRTRRLSCKKYIPWLKSDVELFLEQNCGLTKALKIKGKYFQHHVEVFYYLRELQENAEFNLKFSIDHVDAHGDLGLGDNSFKYISTSLLNKSLKKRAYPKPTKLNSGNFLSFAIACQWVENLKYINKIKWINDIPRILFKNFEIESNIIQLKQYSKIQINKVYEMGNIAKAICPLSHEPEVLFSVIDFNNFISADKYDLVFITQSPGFTPKTSDELLPIITQYIEI